MSTETITRTAPPHPKRFYIHNCAANEFQKVRGHSVTVPGMEAFDLFVFTDDAGDLRLTEGKTGAKLLTRESEDELIREAKRLFPHMEGRGYPSLETQIEKSVEKYGLSPRWTP